MSSISPKAVGGDPSASATSNNPVKSDGELQVLMQKLDGIKKYDTFHRWKGKFLARFEAFLYEKGMKPAQDSANRLQDSLEGLVKKTERVLDHIHQGQLSETKKTVKASLALQEMCNDLEKVRGYMATDIIPSFKSDERKMGYSKFHLGAVLIRQGFQQYSVMKAIEEAVTETDAKLQNVADRQQHDLFAQYHTQVQRFCDVMADLNLYDIMLKCVQFQNPPGEDESEEPETMQIILHYVEDGRRVPIDVEETEVLPRIHATAQMAFGLNDRPLVIKYQGKPLYGVDIDDSISGKTLKQLDIGDDDVLDVELLRIPITVHNTWDDMQIELSVEPLLYITDLKRLLETKLHIPAGNQNLTMNDQSINDVTKRLNDYNVVAGSVLTLEPKSVKISVSTPDGIAHEIEVAPSDTVRGIKQEIEDAGGMAVARQVLKDIHGKELPDDGSTIKTLGIRDGAALSVDVFKIPITANCWDGKQFKLMVDPTEALSSLKHQLEDESRILANNQCISFEEVPLNDDTQALQDYGIIAGSVVALEPTVVSLAVQIPDGTVHEVLVSPSDDISTIRQRVEEASGMLAERQVLKDRNGNELPNDRSTIRDLGLRQQDELRVEVFKVPVTVNSWDGQQYETMVDPTDALLDFKTHLESSIGVRVENQLLSLNDEHLQDDTRLLKDYGVKSGSVFYVEPKTIKISVTTPDGVNHSIDIAPSDHSGILKEKIQSGTGMIVARQILTHGNGNELPNDGSTMKDIGIREGHVVSVEIFKIPVKVRSWDGQEYNMMVDPTESFDELKQSLESASGIPSENQRLCYNGEEVQENAKAIGDIGLIAGAVLDLEPKTVSVSIATPAGSTVELNISPSDKCQTIKQKIQDVTGISVVRQVVKDAKGQELSEDDATVRDIGIRDGDSFKVEIFKIPVVVQSWEGHEYHLMVDPTEALFDLKKMLEVESGISVNNQSLCFGNEDLLDNSKALGEYGVQAGSVLQLEPLVIKVLVKAPDDVDHEIEVSPRDDCNSIKQKFEKASGITVQRQVLKFEGGDQVPCEGSTVADMGIKDGTRLDVSIFKLPVTIKVWDGNQFDLLVDPTEALAELKNQAEANSGIAAGNQSVFHRNEALQDDSMQLLGYGIESHSVLNLEPKHLTVVVQTPDGNCHNIEISLSADSKAIKQGIEDMTGMAVVRQVLKDCNGIELPEDGTTVKEMGFHDGSRLIVDVFMIPVTVHSWDGTNFELTIDPTEKLSSLKEGLEVKSEILANNQNLSFDEIPLDDDTKAIEEYGIQRGSILNLEPKCIDVLIETPDGRTHQIEIPPTGDIRTIKSMIEEKSGIIVPRQVLFDNSGKELTQDEATVKQMGIRNGDTLNVQILKVPVVIKCWDGVQHEMLVDPTEKLSRLKEMIKDHFDILPNNQNISLCDNILDDDTKALQDYGVQSGSVLDLEPKSVNVFVSTPNGDIHELSISPSDDTNGIKNRIYAKSNIAVTRQVLITEDGNQLPPEGSTVRDMGIRDGDNLTVEIFRIPISVKCWDSKQYDLSVDPTEELSVLRQRLAADTGISPENQNLSHVNCLLQDDGKSLNEHGIAPGSVLDLEPKIVKVSVAAPDGQVYNIEVSPADNTLSLKQKFEQASGMAVSRQILKSSDGDELPNDGLTVKDMDIRDGSNLTAEVFKIPLTVKSWDNRQFEMSVDPTQSLLDLKQQLEVDTGIPANNQNLSIENEKMLEDAMALQDYGVQAGSVLELEPKYIKLGVTTPDGATHHIEVSPSDDGQAIKAAIQNETGIIIPRQVVLHNGQELPNNGSTVKDMGLLEGDSLSIEIFNITVTVKSWDGTQYELSVDPTEKLLNFKQQLEVASTIPSKNQNLYLGDENLQEDSKVLQEYGVQHGSVLYLEPMVVEVEVTTPDGDKHTIMVSPTDTINAIKQKIESKTGIMIPRQVLKHNGQELNKADDTVKDMGIRDGSALSVEIFKIPVTVKSWDGKQYERVVDPTETLADFKKELEVESGIPASNQTLSLLHHEAVPLVDETRTLHDHGIEAGSILALEPKKINLVVTTPDGATHDIALSPSDDCNTIKQRIQEKTGMAVPRQVLKFNGTELPDGSGATVKDIGIREGSTLKVEIFKVPITIQTKDGQVFKLMLDPTITSGDIKRYLELKSSIPLRYQILSFEGTRLADDSKTAGSYGIVGGSVLDLDRLDDPIVFVDVKCGTLFGVDRDQVIEKGILTPTSQGGVYEFSETIHDAKEKDGLLKAMLGSPNLGVKPQLVVEKLEVEDYDLEEAENVKNKWGVQLKKTQKNKRGNEFIFVDIKTGHVGVLDRMSMIEKKFITPVGFGKNEILEQGEKDAQRYDRFVKEIRRIFRIASL